MVDIFYNKSNNNNNNNNNIKDYLIMDGRNSY